MRYNLNLASSEPVESLSYEQLYEFMRTKLNYGWEFVNLEKTNNSNFPYRVTLNWKKQCIPNSAPYDSKLLQH